MTNANSEKSFFNTRSQGLAYLNEVSDKQTSDGSYVKVKLAALIGPEDDVEYERHVLSVRGEQALGVIESLRGYLTKDNKVTVSFVAADCRAKGFVPETGERAGQLITYQQGKLIFITSARVNGSEVYRAPEREAGREEG